MTKSIIITVCFVIAVAVALYFGFVWGLSTGLKETAIAGEKSASLPAVDTGYQNPFEGVKFNPFK